VSPVDAITPLPGLTARIGWGFYDAAVLSWRNVLRNLRNPTFLFTEVLVVPILFTVLFAYVFGGAIHTPGVSYVDFLMPGVFIQTALVGSINGGVALAEDLEKGMMDRFRSLPIAYWAVPVARVVADLAFDAAGLGIMIAVGYAIGFRFHGTALATTGAVGLVLLFGFSVACLGAVLGAALRTPAAVQGAGGLVIFPLMFASSVFVPVQTMPWWLRAVVQHSPVTYAADAVRHLGLGAAGAAESVTIAVVWAVGIAAICIPLTGYLFRRFNR